MENNFSRSKFLPVMFGFFIMGFVDVVGIATSYIKNDFALSDTLASLIPMFCFFWFLIFAIPTGILMNRIGRKKTVLLSFVLQGVAMLLPLLVYDFAFVLVAFALIGIGNTLLQVSLNPLVTNVVSQERLTSSLTLGQFTKAVSSFLGPILVGWAAGMAFGWKMIFPIYALISLLASVWLALTPIVEEKAQDAKASFGKTFAASFALLKDPYILMFFIGILVLVGVDVGVNITFPKFLMERAGLALGEAGLGNSLYFISRTVGAFVGAILLMKLSTCKFFTYSVLLALVGLALMLLTSNLWFILGCVVLFGLGYANLFSIIFSLSLQRVPEKANEVSALLIMGVSGGALLPPFLGAVSDAFNQWAAMLLLTVVWLYLILLFPKLKAISK